jgi:hypothetical protein
MHVHGMVALAGEVAQRRYSPRSIRIDHGASDRHVVANYAFRCSSSAEQADLLVTLWDTQARDLVRRWWDAIERVAAALLERESLSGDDVKRLLFKPAGVGGGA